MVYETEATAGDIWPYFLNSYKNFCIGCRNYVMLDSLSSETMIIRNYNIEGFLKSNRLIENSNLQFLMTADRSVSTALNVTKVSLNIYPTTICKDVPLKYLNLAPKSGLT